MAKPKAEGSATDFFPERKTLSAFRDAAAGCKACDLWQRGTQTVFGEGRTKSKIMFVGEQPGNDEDLAGRPFVGPAGRPLGKALEQAGGERRPADVTNTMKEFKREPP